MVDDVHVWLAGGGPKRGGELRGIAKFERYGRARRLLEGRDMASLEIVGERPSERADHKVFRRPRNNREGKAADYGRGRKESEMGAHGVSSLFQADRANRLPRRRYREAPNIAR
jgi:hypothetical protein